MDLQPGLNSNRPPIRFRDGPDPGRTGNAGTSESCRYFLGTPQPRRSTWRSGTPDRSPASFRFACTRGRGWRPKASPRHCNKRVARHSPRRAGLGPHRARWTLPGRYTHAHESRFARLYLAVGPPGLAGACSPAGAAARCCATTVASLSGRCATAVSAVPGNRSSFPGNLSRTADTAVAHLESQGFRRFHPITMLQSPFWRQFAALAPAVRPLTAFFLPCLSFSSASPRSLSVTP